MRFQYFLKMTPVPKERPRATKWGAIYTPPKTKEAERLLKSLLIPEMKRQGWELGTDQPIRIELHFIFHRAKSNKKDYHTQRPDLDNTSKLILDSLNPDADLVKKGLKDCGAWHDDCQIIDLRAVKHWCGDSVFPDITEAGIYIAMETVDEHNEADTLACRLVHHRLSDGVSGGLFG